jgi:DNA-binding beta-propeller fold protein YncE
VGGTPTVVAAYATGFRRPIAVALDAANNRLYVTDNFPHTLAQVNNVGGTPTVVPAYAGFNSPNGVALDAANNRLYVADGTVAQVNNVGGTPTVVAAYATGFSAPIGVALAP